MQPCRVWNLLWVSLACLDFQVVLCHSVLAELQKGSLVMAISVYDSRNEGWDLI